MKKTILSILLLVGFSLSIVAEETIPTSFPRKILLEHFTSQKCVFCPNGILAINQALYENPDKYIWIAHHQGYSTDAYTIQESNNIKNLFNVTGSPMIMLNRNYQKINGVKNRLYDPSALVNGSLTMLDADTAVLSVIIERDYNPTTRELQITVHGQVANPAISAINVSTVIKENALAGEQADAYFAWSGIWQEYLHMATLRDFYCSKAIGDEIAVINQTYSKTYTVTVDSTWVDENCTIVAFATKTDGYEVYNAAEVPLVEGTDGGNSNISYGIMQKAQPKTPIVFSQILAQQKVDPNILQIMLLSTTNVRPEGNQNFYYGACKPVALLYVVTTDNKLQPGTYPVLDDLSFNSVVAGFRVDTLGSLGGSLLIYASAQYLQNKQIVAAATWRMQSGSLTMDKDGNIYFKVGTCYGTEVEGVYNISTAIGYTEQDADNQTIYNILGQPIDQDPTHLPQGVYIQNGSKFIKK